MGIHILQCLTLLVHCLCTSCANIMVFWRPRTSYSYIAFSCWLDVNWHITTDLPDIMPSSREVDFAHQIEVLKYEVEYYAWWGVCLL